MLDVQEQYCNCKEPVNLWGRWNGQGAAPPVAIAKTTRPTGPTGGGSSGGPITITRSGVGTLLVTLPNPLGIIQNYGFWTACPANNKNVQIAPPAVGGNSFALQISYHANAVAVDLVAGEELLMAIVSSLSNNP